MGSPKALLSLGGQTFFDRVAGALAPAVERTLVLGTGPVPESAAGFSRLEDVDAPGPLGGLLAAFAFAPRAAWIIVSCDLPLWSTDAVRWLIGERSDEAWAVLPRLHVGQIEPLAALYEP